MTSPWPPGYRQIQTFGCVALLLALTLLCVLPWLFVETMHTALERLHLGPAAASISVLAILLGSFFNLPLYSIERDEEQVIEMVPTLGGMSWAPGVVRRPTVTLIAVNVGGCIVPSLIALWQLRFLSAAGGDALRALVIVAGANVVACYLLARPIRGVGIGMPWFASPAVAVGLTWLMLSGQENAELRAPVAFVAGVAGPLIGADLLRLKDITRISVGVLSIGGAGTFDGIVLSGIIAALLA